MINPVYSAHDKSIFSFRYYASCVHYVIDFLCFVQRRWIFTRCEKYNSGVINFMHQNFVLLQVVYWKIFILRFLTYRVSDDHKRIDTCSKFIFRNSWYTGFVMTTKNCTNYARLVCIHFIAFLMLNQYGNINLNLENIWKSLKRFTSHQRGFTPVLEGLISY